MEFAHPLISGKLISRYKRFLADVLLENGEVVTAHCPNSGAMLGATKPGSTVWLEYLPHSTRKLAYTWHFIEEAGQKIGINTHIPNKLILEALSASALPSFQTYTSVQSEIKCSALSRLDFLLTDSSGNLCYIEVKNVHLKRSQYAEFPDCPTIRGVRHLKELCHLRQKGHRAVVIYVVQREDCDGFKVAADLDPTYQRMAQEAVAKGVEFLSYACGISSQSILLTHPLPLVED